MSPLISALHPPFPTSLLLSILSRQDSASPSGSGTPIALIVVLAVVVVLVLTIFIFVLTRVLLQRRAIARGAAADDLVAFDFPPQPTALRYFPAQPPALVRRQRLAQTAGLSLDELGDVAPVMPFERRHDEEDTCAVCLEEMDGHSKTRRMPCGHAFDAKYVWFLSSLSMCAPALFRALH